MTSPKPKGPTPIVLKEDGPYKRQVDIPATAVSPDPYQPDALGESIRQGQLVNPRKTRAQFRQIEFQRAILQHGQYVIWSKALICPCQNATTNQARVNCLTCDGSGFFYTDPMEIRALMTSLERNQRVFEKFGSWVEGTSSMTVEPQYRPDYGDRIEMRDAVMPHSELFTKGNRRGIRSRLPEKTDSLRYRVTRMTVLIYEADDDQHLALEENYHFKVTEDGWIEWLYAGEQMIEDGTTLSALYEYHPIYLVMSHPHATRTEVTGVKVPEPVVYALPIQALVKLDFLTDITTPLPAITTILRKAGPT